MFLVDEKMGAAAVDEDDEVDELLLVFCRLGGGAVTALTALLEPVVFPLAI
jgi:hypothetical protein